jgi:hypothetical protein
MTDRTVPASPGLQFTSVRHSSPGTKQGRRSSLNRSERLRPELLMRLALACCPKGRSLSRISHGLSGRDRTMASSPDARQDADLPIRIPAHWPDTLH